MQIEIFELVIAILIGCIIGVEREYRDKSAGFRTMILVSLGATMFTILSTKIGSGSPDRIAANIVTGVGFLGAGVIFKDQSRISGITTATTIWITAALGMAVGAGQWQLGLAGAILVLVVLVIFNPLQHTIQRLSQTRIYTIKCTYTPNMQKAYEAIFKTYHLRPFNSKLAHEADRITASWAIGGKADNHEALIDYLQTDPNIIEFEFSHQ
jgi:putative Mg2+ transporter-C (MgtC) family protein